MNDHRERVLLAEIRWELQQIKAELATVRVVLVKERGPTAGPVPLPRRRTRPASPPARKRRRA